MPYTIKEILEMLNSDDPEKYIPVGPYCHFGNRIDHCSYWKLNSNRPKYFNGYCYFLRKGDWMKNGTLFLWEQLKECLVKHNEEHYFDELSETEKNY